MSEFGEPWRVVGPVEDYSTIRDSGGDDVATLVYRDGHAERIAACVNYFAGIPTEVIHVMIKAGGHKKQQEEMLEMAEMTTSLGDLLGVDTSGIKKTLEEVKKL